MGNRRFSSGDAVQQLLEDSATEHRRKSMPAKTPQRRKAAAPVVEAEEQEEDEDVQQQEEVAATTDDEEDMVDEEPLRKTIESCVLQVELQFKSRLESFQIDLERRMAEEKGATGQVVGRLKQAENVLLKMREELSAARHTIEVSRLEHQATVRDLKAQIGSLQTESAASTRAAAMAADETTRALSRAEAAEEALAQVEEARAEQPLPFLPYLPLLPLLPLLAPRTAEVVLVRSHHVLLSVNALDHLTSSIGCETIVNRANWIDGYDIDAPAPGDLDVFGTDADNYSIDGEWVVRVDVTEPGTYCEESYCTGCESCDP
jgi:hypothetical protein